jgi:glycosyltransferase involved in cell wall biosynthesis
MNFDAVGKGVAMTNSCTAERLPCEGRAGSLPISVTILTKNSQQYLVEVLDALQVFDEIIIFDNGSTDCTLAIAERYGNVSIQHGEFQGFGPTHNIASSLARNDWILSVDSDEVVTSELCEELRGLQLDPGCIYAVPRRNFYNGRWIRWCGWSPDRQRRLYNRKKTSFCSAQVHEAIVIADLNVVDLQGALIHYSYRNLADFLAKMQAYSSLFAAQYAGKRHSSPLRAIGHGTFAFLKSYLIKGGCLGGYEGFVISAYNGHTAFYKYLKLYEANQATAHQVEVKAD